MTSYENEPFLVGDYTHSETEFMHFSHQKWYTIEPYQNEKPIFGYSAVSLTKKIFIIGGCCDKDWSKPWSNIALFENYEWSIIGKLNHGRKNFMTVLNGNEIMIIGGTSYDNKT